MNIHENIFEKNKNLETIELSSNFLSAVPADLFYGLGILINFSFFSFSYFFKLKRQIETNFIEQQFYSKFRQFNFFLSNTSN
jgi:hypothetical protein